MKYFKRAGIYKASNLDFDPKTGLGHSYSWYEISKTIRGQLVLNTYNYSTSTLKHYRKLWNLMDDLGLDYICVEAPRGLQSLDSAKRFAAELMAKAIVENKYARKKSDWAIERAQKNIDNLKLIGVRVTKKDIQLAVAEAEINRADRLRWKRESLARKRAAQESRVPALSLIQGGVA